MADVVALTADMVKETFPNVSLDQYRYLMVSMDKSRIILVLSYACLFLIGTISNFYVACVLASLLRFSSAETPRAIRIFVFALCCFDLAVLAFIPFLLFDLIYSQWAVPNCPLLCQLYLCSESVNKFCSPFLLVAMSAFCYLKICHPSSTSFRQITHTNDSGNIGRDFYTPLLIVATCIVLAFALATPIYIYGDIYYLVVYNESQVRLIIAKCAFHPPDFVLTLFTVYCFIFGYVIPATSFTIFYIAVVIRVKRQKTRNRSTWSLGNGEPGISQNQNGRSRRLERAIRTCVGLVLFYLACWTPYWAMNLKQYFLVPIDESDGTYHPNDTDAVAGYFIHMLPYINCAGYPILHAILNRNIRRDCKRLKEKRKRRRGLRLLMMQVENERRSAAGQEASNFGSNVSTKND